MSFNRGTPGPAVSRKGRRRLVPAASSSLHLIFGLDPGALSAWCRRLFLADLA